jgi:hypothetical protein
MAVIRDAWNETVIELDAIEYDALADDDMAG